MGEYYLTNPEKPTKTKKEDDTSIFYDKLEKDLNYYISQHEAGIINKKDLDEITTKIGELLKKFSKEKDGDLKKEYENWKRELQERTGLELKKVKWILEYQLAAYKLHGLDKHTYKNSTRDMFTKGMIDAFFVENTELLEQIKERGIGIISDIINYVFSWEGIKEIAKKFGEDIGNLFVGDAYERGKSVIELGLVGMGLNFAQKGGKIAIKETLLSLKNRDYKTGKLKDITIDTGIISPDNIDEILNKVNSGKKLDHTDIQALNTKIITNNPAFGIFDKFKKGDRFVSVIFTGIKGVNDTFSQVFTDNIFNNFKKQILNKYDGILPVWNDYKNFVLKIDNPNAIIPSQEELNKLLKEIYEEEIAKLSKSELETIKNNLSKKGKELPELGSISEEGIIKGKSQKDIMMSLAETRSRLEAKSMGDIVLNINKLVEKLETIKEKYSNKGDYSEILTDSRGRTKYTIKNGVLQKEFTINQTGKKVINRISILDAKGNINEKIINLVRKNEIPKELELFQDINQIIKSAVANGEFIGPFIKEIGLINGDLIDPKIFSRYQQIKKRLIKGRILTRDEKRFLRKISEKSYKKALEKENFYSKIKKPGGLLFIDIAGMGNINISDFIAKIKQYHAGKITKEQMLLDSGNIMTNRFQDLLKGFKDNIQKLYPGKKINFYVGGDEVGIFIEGVNIFHKDTLSTIYKELDSNGLEGRMTKKIVNNDDLVEGGKKVFEKLDKLTKYSKVIEKRIDETIEEIKVALRETLIKDAQEKISKLEQLKNFDITVNKGELFINFNSVNLEKGIHSFRLDKIIDLETNKLKPDPGSPFINYLINNNLERDMIGFEVAA